ncbi:13927_t:CDS:1 [Acaulospora colombiana]|uniref:13927_t:CDS:1 n=1 Tax=Acaulospora colombiana TaxID=27376 RepID=A0ACA9LSE2_9GLOM|nr:13927_t:CDS:1 [Acaulospora colombiana]
MNENEPHDHNNITADDRHPNSTSEKKKKSRKRIKRLANHCNRSRIVLFLLFVGMIAAVVLIAIFLKNNPSIFIRPQCRASYGAASLNSTFSTLGQLETGLNYDSNSEYRIVSPLGLTGKYQFSEQELKDLGYYIPKDNIYYNNGSDKNYWLGTFTGKNGCNSYQDFLDNKFDVQEIAIREEFQMDLKILNNSLPPNKSLTSFLDKPLRFTGGCNINLGGVMVANVTMAGILASAHLIGATDVARALTSGIAPCDVTNTSMTTYLTSFNGCDFSAEDVAKAVNSFNNSTVSGNS